MKNCGLSSHGLSGLGDLDIADSIPLSRVRVDNEADPTGLSAAFMRRADKAKEAKQQQQQSPPQNSFGNGSPLADTRSYLLNLLPGLSGEKAMRTIKEGKTT
ncbi:hypothetical protein CEP53_001950 [Fusarium sp. AF-6]|nr:hypothetical protein CEP53_001950 [Fusarium sp. AF-6]